MDAPETVSLWNMNVTMVWASTAAAAAGTTTTTTTTTTARNTMNESVFGFVAELASSSSEPLAAHPKLNPPNPAVDPKPQTLSPKY